MFLDDIEGIIFTDVRKENSMKSPAEVPTRITVMQASFMGDEVVTSWIPTHYKGYAPLFIVFKETFRDPNSVLNQSTEEIINKFSMANQ